MEVSNLAADTSSDLLTFFFENKRRTGGGEIENLELVAEEAIAFITYVSEAGNLSERKKMPSNISSN